MAYPLRIPKLHTVYHRASYSGPYSSPCTQAIYRKQLSPQRRSRMPMIPCCVGESVDQVTTTLNKALEELALWCKHIFLVPNPKKCEGMILKRNHLRQFKINQFLIKWSLSSKLFGVTIDNKLTWSKYISELKRRFVNKLNLIKSSRFLPRNSLLDLHFKVVLPSVTYALPIWGCCTNKNEFNSLESKHCIELYITSRATCPLRM